ncbi:ATP-binding cassette domain-containing protein [Actinobaculum sp. 313]|uniref:ABC transporter ATP-binding protein n=1 Tax=Actinobaculum sp. 313 TaxID=2495645 RepID=UPI000D52681E|nr:ATP-binding cassette domain-containing protein [Actinobaculum sp. 313]AWE41759.1 daunorubicin/doxorubicin resistance ABC transporter ATP-binding protein DrrA [Actinobaculum sp. 313]
MSSNTVGNEPILAVRQIHKSFGKNGRKKDVLKGLSFDVLNHQVVCLLGANGAGKTTLVNIASTLMLPSSGTISVCGADVVKQADEVRRFISLTGQFAAVDGELTGRENLVFFSRLHGLPPREAKARADELLEQFRLADAATQRVATYSGGMRRRLDIAASLVVEPRLLFLDEPTTGLDPLSRRELWETVEQLRDRGVAVLLTTQYLDEAERLSDDVVLIRDGQVVLHGPPAAIREEFGAPLCQLTFRDTADSRRVAQTILISEFGPTSITPSLDGLTVSFTAHGGVQDLSRALTAIQNADIVTVSAALTPPTLDDVFLGTAFTAAGAS